MIVATRNRLIHGYLGIDNDTLWSIVMTDVPALLSELQNFGARCVLTSAGERRPEAHRRGRSCKRQRRVMRGPPLAPETIDPWRLTTTCQDRRPSDR